MAEVAVKVKSPELAARKLLERFRAARGFYIYGVQNPKRSPTEAAISMKDTLARKMADSKTWDKWEEKRKAVGDAGWLTGVLEKGVHRLEAGMDVGIAYWLQFFNQFKGHLEAGLAKVYRLPRVTLEDSIKRAAEMIRHNAQFSYTKKGLSPDEVKSIREKILGITLPT
mgnify:CR=1 FL=1